MGIRPLLLALVVAWSGTGAVLAQRDPERPPPQVLQPGPSAPPAEKVEPPSPALPTVVGVCCALLVLFVVCKPSRKSLPT